jgi:hypothetical protein
MIHQNMDSYRHNCDRFKVLLGLNLLLLKLLLVGAQLIVMQ